MSVILKGHISSAFSPTTGVLQGYILSPFLYSLYINNLPLFLRSQEQYLPRQPPRLFNHRWLNLLLYADDCVLIGCPDNIQALLDSCTIIPQFMGFKWNASKSIVLSHSALTSSLYLNSEPIPVAQSFDYLGIPIPIPFKIDAKRLIEKNAKRANGATASLNSIGIYSKKFLLNKKSLFSPACV
jgi:hypothetical protein